MSSWLVRMFMDLKAEVYIDEARRKQRRTLDLSSTYLTNISFAAMNQLYCSEFQRLLLQYNYLRELPKDFGVHMIRLDFLALDYNEFSEIPESFSMLENLVYLNISNNPFTKFPIQICHLKNLRTLWANGIGIKKIPNEIIELKKLKVLGIRNNFLTRIPTDICALEELEWLTLQNNRIRSVPAELYNLRAIIHLNLSYNEITELPYMAKCFPKLQFLYLESNRIEVEDSLVCQIQSLPNLKKAYLKGNPFSTEKYKTVTRRPIVSENFQESMAEDIQAQASSPEEAELQFSSFIPTPSSEIHIVEEHQILQEHISFTPFISASEPQLRRFSSFVAVPTTSISEYRTRNQPLEDLLPTHEGAAALLEMNINNENGMNQHANTGIPGEQLQPHPEQQEAPAPELNDFNLIDPWELSEPTSELDDFISGSDHSDTEDLPLDPISCLSALKMGILTS